MLSLMGLAPQLSPVYGMSTGSVRGAARLATIQATLEASLSRFNW